MADSSCGTFMLLVRLDPTVAMGSLILRVLVYFLERLRDCTFIIESMSSEALVSGAEKSPSLSVDYLQ